MKYNLTYILYCVIFGCFIIVKNGGVVENFWYTTSALYTTFIILKNIYDTSKTIMVNTYIDEYCEEISTKLNNKENSIKIGVFNDLRYVLDECIVKEEYYIAQNISAKLGKIFRDFLNNSIQLLDEGENKKEIEESFERIVNVGIYQLELSSDINSRLLINEIKKQQVENIKFCIKSNQYGWFEKYINSLSRFTFSKQKEEEDIVVSETFDIYVSILKILIQDEKEAWIRYMVGKLFSMTTSLNFLSSNINLKYFASLIVYGLLNCKEGEIYNYLYGIFEDFTNVAGRISEGFVDIKAYYALYFNDIIDENNEKHIEQFLKTIFKYGQSSVNDTVWTEFKFYCIKEVLIRKDKIDIDINKYHVRLLVEIIEMKEQYNGYMFLPQFEKKFKKVHSSKDEYEHICKEMRYLLNQCIINDNLNLFFLMIKCVNNCMVNTKAKDKDLQITLLDLFIWLIERTKKLNNKQFLEIIFIELSDIIKELDKEKAISRNFGDKIIVQLSDVARNSNSDSYDVILQIIELFSDFLRENEELYFVNNYIERKEKLYKGLYNIGISCIENDFEEGVRRCSNTLGWFTIYSIKQGNTKLTKYLIELAKEMLEIAKDMNITRKTETFLLTLFTTVGTYCCKEINNYVYIDLVLEAICKVPRNLVYTAIKIRTYENDMWDELLDNKTQQLSREFKKKYEEYIKNNKICDGTD